MPVSNDLLLTILSMDAYNRGYGAGISDGGANDDPDGLGENGFVGNARILARSDGIDYDAWQAAGFYAVAYDTPDGIVISYRGTDAMGEFVTTDPSIFILDNFTETQFSLAVEFYNSVKSANPGKDITLTGHSLGGALAGYVATLFREDVQLADHIDFEGPLQAFAVARERTLAEHARNML